MAILPIFTVLQFDSQAVFRIDLITLFAAFGSFQGLLFSFILWFRKKSKLSDRIFSLLLFATSIRIAKNIIVHIRTIDPDMDMSMQTWRMLVNIGLTHQFAIGPLFLLYFVSRTKEKFVFKRAYLWHFLPYGLLMLTSPIQEWSFWAKWGLWASYISILLYYLFSVGVYIRSFRNNEMNDGFIWLKNLLIICGLLLLSYSPALFKYIGYIGGAVLYAIGIYAVSLMVLGKGKFFSYFQNKYPGSSIKALDSKALLNDLKVKMEMEHIYLDSKLSLSKLADKLNVSSNLLSQVINTEFSQSFTDYVNSFRVAKAKQMLSKPEHQKTKIVAIAFDCGFNSLSTFNTVFKKNTGYPPNEFRRLSNQ